MDIALFLQVFGIDVVAVGAIALLAAAILYHVLACPQWELLHAIRTGTTEFVEWLAEQRVAVLASLVLAGALAGTVLDIVADELLDNCTTIGTRTVFAPIPDISKVFHPRDWDWPWNWRGVPEEDILKTRAIIEVRNRLGRIAPRAALILDPVLADAHCECTSEVRNSDPAVRGFVDHALATLRASGGDTLNSALRLEGSAIRLMNVLILTVLLFSVAWIARALILLVRLAVHGNARREKPQWQLRLPLDAGRHRNVTERGVVFRAGQIAGTTFVLWLVLGILVRVWVERSMAYYQDVVHAYVAIEARDQKWWKIKEAARTHPDSVHSWTHSLNASCEWFLDDIGAADER